MILEYCDFIPKDHNTFCTKKFVFTYWKIAYLKKISSTLLH